jgi:hypothetical protein
MHKLLALLLLSACATAPVVRHEYWAMRAEYDYDHGQDGSVAFYLRSFRTRIEAHAVREAAQADLNAQCGGPAVITEYQWGDAICEGPPSSLCTPGPWARGVMRCES